jgi:hypothetical protein
VILTLQVMASARISLIDNVTYKEPTRNSAILDLMLTDIHKFYQAPLVLAPIGTSDHCTIIRSLQEQMKHKQKSKRINVRPLKSSSLQAFEQYISEYNWSPVLNASCINDKVSKFLEITTEMVEAFFPLKSVKIQVDDKPFLNGRIKQLIQKRDKVYIPTWKSRTIQAITELNCCRD